MLFFYYILPLSIQLLFDILGALSSYGLRSGSLALIFQSILFEREEGRTSSLQKIETK